jgi:hypothetical protein
MIHGTTPETDAHRERIIQQAGADIRAKYDRGMREHGGQLWRKEGLLDMALEEALDLVVYLYTLREQGAGRTLATPEKELATRCPICSQYVLHGRWEEHAQVHYQQARGRHQDWSMVQQPARREYAPGWERTANAPSRHPPDHLL